MAKSSSTVKPPNSYFNRFAESSQQKSPKELNPIQFTATFSLDFKMDPENNNNIKKKKKEMEI